jgi:hypothetical protein
VRPGTRRLAVALLAASQAWASGAAAGSAEPRLPYDLAVRIRFGAGPGSASLLDDAADALLPELRAKGCFRAVSLAEPAGVPEGDVLMEVTLSEVREETRYEQSVAERAQPIDAAQAALGLVAAFSLRAQIRLASIPGGTVVREAGFGAAAERRPRSPGDDAQAGVRAEALLDFARRARAKLCHGSMSRLSRDIDEARRTP